MGELTIDYQKVRNTLKTKRNLLFADFLENPSNTRLALEIRLLDDQIANLASKPATTELENSLNSNSVVQGVP